jgi:hypothetical protein
VQVTDFIGVFFTFNCAMHACALLYPPVHEVQPVSLLADLQSRAYLSTTRKAILWRASSHRVNGESAVAGICMVTSMECRGSRHGHHGHRSTAMMGTESTSPRASGVYFSAAVLAWDEHQYQSSVRWQPALVRNGSAEPWPSGQDA